MYVIQWLTESAEAVETATAGTKQGNCATKGKGSQNSRIDLRMKKLKMKQDHQYNTIDFDEAKIFITTILHAGLCRNASKCRETETKQEKYCKRKSTNSKIVT